MKKSFLILSFATGVLSAQTSTFITDGDWLEAANWDTGVIVPDNQNALINADAIVDRNTGTANADNPSRIEIGSGPGASGSVTRKWRNFEWCSWWGEWDFCWSQWREWDA
jgi:hypothetical protein